MLSVHFLTSFTLCLNIQKNLFLLRHAVQYGKPEDTVHFSGHTNVSTVYITQNNNSQCNAQLTQGPDI
jgi:hypothetical protein